MINRSITFSDFDYWCAYAKKMHELLNAAPLVNVLFVIGYNCSICCNYFITMRTRPCYHMTCHKCMPRPMYCSKECGEVFKEPMSYEEFRKYCTEVLDKGQGLRGFSVTFSIKISPGGTFSSKMYQKLQDSSKKKTVKTVQWRRHDF
eukprot:XP_016663538.1 PREDICTED: uncharacterized protein LOC107884930 [Acyrthosiphon pisum]